MQEIDKQDAEKVGGGIRNLPFRNLPSGWSFEGPIPLPDRLPLPLPSGLLPG